MGLSRGGRKGICQHCFDSWTKKKYGLPENSYLMTSRTFLAFLYGQMQMAPQRDEFLKRASCKIKELCKFKIMNLKIEQRDAVAPFLEDGTDVVAVLLMVFKEDFSFPTLCHCCKWRSGTECNPPK